MLEQCCNYSKQYHNSVATLGRDAFFSLASQALRACEARALRARKTLTTRFTDFFTDFEKKKKTVLQSIANRLV